MRREARASRALIDRIAVQPENILDGYIDAVASEKTAKIVASYWSSGREFDPAPLTEHIADEGLICALPVIMDDSRILRFAQWTPETKMEKGAYDILQPVKKVWVEPDIMLVPLLAFDRKGYRLGQGGGYYDATIRHYRSRKDILAIGVAYAEQAVLFDLPRESHDEKLDMVITPQGVHRF